VQTFVYSVIVHYVWEANKEKWITPKPPPAAPVAERPAISATRIVGLAAVPQTGPLGALPVLVGVLRADAEAPEVKFYDLEVAGTNPSMRAYYEGKRVKLTGRYAPLDETSFTLVRFRYTCCGADATPLKARIVLAKAASADTKRVLPVAALTGKWVRVTGRVHFWTQPGTGATGTALFLDPTPSEPLDKLIEILPNDPNPYEY
jgi:hypothetical protein